MTIFFRDNTGTMPLAQEVSVQSNHLAHTAPSSIYRRCGKRCLDVILILLAAPQIILLVGLLALLVACQGGQPFYTQLRVGKNGRLYKMWKLRSMTTGAETALESHLAQNPAARAEWDETQKLKDDPRVTGFGRFLRRTSLDELPQLWNVLRGDMSLVGPRPMMPDQMDLYPGQQYYELRPGITGLWQISERNTSSFAKRAYYDDAYNETLSLSEDCRILSATVTVVLRGTGH